MSSKYFEGFEVGEKFITMGRTITRYDVSSYCGLAGIYLPLFVDEEYGKQTMFGTTIVPGPLTFIISLGLTIRLGLLDESAIAFLGVEQQTAYAPVRCGDTIRCEMEVIQKRETRHADRGIIKFKFTSFNQHSEKVMDWVMGIMLKRRTM